MKKITLLFMFILMALGLSLSATATYECDGDDDCNDGDDDFDDDGVLNCYDNDDDNDDNDDDDDDDDDNDGDDDDDDNDDDNDGYDDDYDSCKPDTCIVCYPCSPSVNGCTDEDDDGYDDDDDNDCWDGDDDYDDDGIYNCEDDDDDNDGVNDDDDDDDDNDGVNDDDDDDDDNDGVRDDNDGCVNRCVQCFPCEDPCGPEDSDHDGVGDICDNCLNVVNPGQEDSDDDGMGDACDDPCENNNLPVFNFGSFSGDLGEIVTIYWTYSDADVDDVNVYLYYSYEDINEEVQIVAIGVVDADDLSYAWDSTGLESKSPVTVIGIAFDGCGTSSPGGPPGGEGPNFDSFNIGGTGEPIPEFTGFGALFMILAIVVGYFAIVHNLKKK